MQSNNTNAFFELVRAGLWEKDVQLSQYGTIDFNEILRLSEDMTVVGLVAAGIEHVVDVKLPQEVVLQFIGRTLQIEQRNSAMNDFMAVVVEKMRSTDICTLLVKGQGIAQCYERPLWRSSGDIDFLLNTPNYKKAIDFVLPLSSHNNPEGRYSKHRSFIVETWSVELHGTLRSGLSAKVDRLIDSVQEDTFQNGNTREWLNKGTRILLPGVDNDIIFIFTHFLMHFYREVLGLKQICDWCRLLWTFRHTINAELLERRLYQSGLISEWKAFASMAVDYLGMPSEAMPLYDSNEQWHKKGSLIIDYIINRTAYRRINAVIKIAGIFPYKTLRFLPSIVLNINWLKIKERLLKNDNRQETS